MRGIFITLIAVLAAQSVQAQSEAELRFAKSVLQQAQTFTLQAGKEFCGYIGIDRDGKMRATNATRGRLDECYSHDPPEDWNLIASYHTHGTFDPDVDSEVPSVLDVEADNSEGVNGYIATPGGRMWFVDGKNLRARQICGVGCLQSDPAFEPELFGPVANGFTLRELRRRERQ